MFKKIGITMGIMGILAVLLQFAFYGGLILLAVWAVGKFIIN
jgi:hypothetical protein